MQERCLIQITGRTVVTVRRFLCVDPVMVLLLTALAPLWNPLFFTINQFTANIIFRLSQSISPAFFSPRD